MGELALAVITCGGGLFLTLGAATLLYVVGRNMERTRRESQQRARSD